MIKCTEVFMRWGRPIFLLVFFCSADSEAWTSKTYQLFVVKSTELMPASFKNIMLRHQEEILSGCLRPDDLPESQHTYSIANKSGYLVDRLTQLSNKVAKDIYDHVPFKLVSQDFGRMSHYIADLNYLLLLSDNDERESQYRS